MFDRLASLPIHFKAVGKAVLMVKLKDLHRGLWFTFKPYDYPKASQVWVKVDYDRSCKKYFCICWDDTSKSRLVSGDREVFTDFTF